MSGGAITDPIRRRAASLAAALLVCAGLAVLLVVASRTIAYLDQQARGVEVFVSPREERPPARTTQAPVRTEQSSQAVQSDEPATPSVEAQMLRRMLGCVRRPGERPRAGCPTEPTPQDWERPSVRLGGDFAPEEQPNLARIYTRAELDTIVMPSCMRDRRGVCIPFGTTPPPPSRSAEELCEMEGIGPCRPPPFREDETAQ